MVWEWYLWIYTPQIFQFSIENISFMTSTVSRPVRWNCFFCWVDPSGFFRQTNAAIYEIINFTSVERCCIHERKVNSDMFKSKHGPFRTILGLRAVHNFHNRVSIADWRALLTLQLSEFCDTAYLAAFAIKNSYKAISFFKRFSLFVGFSESLLSIDVHVGEFNINTTNLTKGSQSFHQSLNRLCLSWWARLTRKLRST